MHNLYEVDFNTASGWNGKDRPRPATPSPAVAHPLDPDDATKLSGELIFLDPAHHLGYITIGVGA